jgi:hypothetical protein
MSSFGATVSGVNVHEGEHADGIAVRKLNDPVYLGRGTADYPGPLFIDGLRAFVQKVRPPARAPALRSLGIVRNKGT